MRYVIRERSTLRIIMQGWAMNGGKGMRKFVLILALTGLCALALAAPVMGERRTDAVHGSQRGRGSAWTGRPRR